MTTATKAFTALAFMLLAVPSAASAQPALLGAVEFRAESIAAIPQWQRVLDRIEEERPTYRACAARASDCPTRAVRAWQSLVRSQRGHDPAAQVQSVNNFINDWRYRTDMQNYGVRDYWATPLEFFARSGDCEDYAIAKYVTLRQLGFPAEQLRMVVVHDMQRDLAHAVLAVYLEGEVFILDNLTRQVLPHTEVGHYVPYYSVNEGSRWAHVSAESDELLRSERRVAPSTAEQDAASSY